MLHCLFMPAQGTSVDTPRSPPAGLILELFPSLEHVDFIVRSRNERTSSLCAKLSQRFDSVTVQVREAGEVDDVLPRADIVCT